MQENRESAVGFGHKPDILNPQCSCTKCDSVSCFTKRQAEKPCACEICKNFKSCPFYNTDITLGKSDKKYIPCESKSESKNIKAIERGLLQENVTSEVIKSKTIYELDKNNHMKVISTKQSKISYKSVNSNDKIGEDKNYSLKKAHSADIADRHIEVGPSAAKLSAQVMDMPYDDFQNSIAKPPLPITLTNISPYDILSRIKEAYKACSCKVCECIVGKSLQNDLCKCKPCECNDCASFSNRMKSFTNSEVLVPQDDEGCPCIRCNRGSCKGINQNSKTRGAQQCDCVGVLQCLKHHDNFSRACNCEPCQCIECVPRSSHRHRAFIVAPVGEEYQHRNVCQCSPCECFECGRGFSLSTNPQNEMSTSMNRHPHCLCETCVNEACIPDGNESCRCERQSKVMSKPFQQDTHDYDIRRTIVTHDNNQKRKKVKNYDTIAMFAAITNAYPKPKTSNKQCNCDQCKCLVCESKKITENTHSSKVVFEPIHNYQFKNEVNYSPDYKHCDKYETKLLNLKKVNVCTCEVCDCIACDGLAHSNIESNKYETKKPKSKFFAKSDCTCNPCECADCEKLMSTCVGDICACSNCRCCIHENSDELIYPVKRGERLTPSLFRRKIKDAFIESCINTLQANEEILKQPITDKSSKKKPSAFRSVRKTNTQVYCDTSNQKDLHECYLNNFTTRTETVKHAQIAKCINGLNLSKKNEATLESDLSAYSSISFLKENGSITPSRCKLKSWQSSCNSSGHDYPDYLIHFPKAVVETTFNNVEKYKNNNTDLEPMTLRSKHNQHNRECRLQPPKCLPMRTIYSQENPTNSIGSQAYNNEDNNCINYYQNVVDHPNCQSFEATSNYIGNTRYKQVNSVTKDSDRFTPGTYEEQNIFGSFAAGEDYKRVQNTLQEARAFSLHLVQLLEKYEKANREFESVCKMIKTSDTNSVMHHDKEINYAFDKDERPTKEQHRDSSGSSTEELVAINKNANKNERVKLLNIHDYAFENSSNDDYESISVPCNASNQCNNEGRDESGDDIINKAIETLKTITEGKEPVDASYKQKKKKKVMTKLFRSYTKMYKRSIICSKKIKSLKNSSSVDAGNSTDTGNEPLIQKISKPIIKEIRNRRIDINNDFSKEIKKNFNIDAQPRIEENMNLLKLAKKSTTELKIVTEKFIKENHIFQDDVIMIKQPMHEHKSLIVDEPWSVSKKSFYLDTNTNSHSRRTFSPLEISVKGAAQTIMKQSSDENATYLYENRALSAGSSCEAMKVNFLNVRRVSDHTVLVKWNTPRVLSNVVGYELLVDGRPVQKIFSPSRRMAVVTCLPHNDKVLLTVRTVISLPCPDHSPATTVIYQPKIK